MTEDISSTVASTATEKALAGIWAAVLERDVESIGRDDDFVVLGGSSLEATVCVVRVEQTLGVRLPVNALIIGDGTLHRIAGRIDALRTHA